jgi:hypothetical protein
MKLFNVVDNEKVEELLSEKKKTPSLTIDEEPVKRPIGISAEEFTEEYKERLEDIRRRRPNVYKKIINGN